MIRILWLCNIPIPIIANDIGIEPNNNGGWLEGLANDLKERNDLELIICFPILNQNEIIRGNTQGIKYYGVPKKNIKPEVYDFQLEEYLKKVIHEAEPDIVHIFGTEYPHTLAMSKVFNQKDKLLLNIQGLCSVYERHYYANLPKHIVRKYTIRDLVKKDNIKQQRKKFIKRGEFELEAIKNIPNVIGRTDWDQACVMQINPQVKYYHCNETLRGSFYNSTWDINRCEKYSIFVTQGSYPIKGIHLMIEAMAEVVKTFPEAHLYVGGENIITDLGFKAKIRQSSYNKYIKKLINKNNLNSNITFLGNLNEEDICDRFLKSHIFVSPSVIENSPNSVGEAMLLGVPTITSDVGGVKNMITHNLEGFIYQHDAPYMLAYYILKIFNNEAIALEFSKNAKIHANQTHSRENNLKKMLEIYHNIFKNK